MALAKDYEIAALEVVPATGAAFLEVHLCVTEDGVVLSSANHRFGISAETSLEDAYAMIDGSLLGAGYPALDAADVESLGATLNAARVTPGRALLARPAPPAMGPETAAQDGPGLA